MPLFKKLWGKKDDDESSGDEIEDSSAGELSYVGTAAYDVLRRHFNHYHHELWNVSSANDILELHATPKDAFARTDTVDPPEHHDDWFPEKIGEIIAQTEQWCDVCSLAPPDGLFMAAFKKALADICDRELSLGRITIRILFGNIVGMPVNCNKLIAELTRDLPKDAGSKIKLWVGSWRKGVSWNHAKIVAVDGKHLWTGGHNFWHGHYLKTSPVNDLSIYLKGPVARDGHEYANAQWGYIVKKQSTAWGRFVDKRIPDAVDVPRKARVTVSDWPEGTTAEFPPRYKKAKELKTERMLRGPARSDDGGDNNSDNPWHHVPILSMGRYGVVLKKHRPSDDAIIAMFDSAQTIIRLALQDIGPVCLPKTKMSLPGCRWPKEYLEPLAKVMWLKGVDVELVLSNPNSIPGNLSPTEANYGNGWSCVDVASELIKTIIKLFPDAEENHAKLRNIVKDNLRVCFLRSPRGGTRYNDGATLGLHSKHFIIDDVCCYIGSQNLYICDLAEWGIVIDKEEAVQKIKAEYWDEMWKVSYTREDCDVDDVMDGLKINRDAPSKMELTKIQMEQAKERMRASHLIPRNSIMHAKETTVAESYDISDDESEGEDVDEC
mmetsp:Transcript_43746/g.106076  ORF Transcript_43746/g.106076 Transcript_43746/m.106076 type:complete len:606 (+) Transcript_43746:139-1956(+)